MKTIATALTALLLTLAALPAHAGEATDTARSLISRQKTVIAALAHPSATLRSIQLTDWDTTSRGLTLKYDFNYESIWGNSFTSTLQFHFDSSGAFTGQLTVTGTSALIPPFSAADVLVEALQEELLQEPQVRNNRVLVSIINQGDAERICELILHLDI